MCIGLNRRAVERQRWSYVRSSGGLSVIAAPKMSYARRSTSKASKRCPQEENWATCCAASLSMNGENYDRAISRARIQHD